jgi:plasmid stabilization system protein ParE
MNRSLFETPRARQDLADILDYLVAANPAAALRFYDAYDVALQLLRKCPSLADVCSCLNAKTSICGIVGPRAFGITSSSIA